MPRIIRWFRVSHDINSDPEVWELTNTFGERALRVWLEILSIADRNSGQIPASRSPDLDGVLARKCRISRQTVAKLWTWLEKRSWVAPGTPDSIRNYLKYNKTRDRNELPMGNKEASPPIQTLHTIHTILPKKEEYQEKEYSPPATQAGGNSLDTTVNAEAKTWIELLNRNTDKHYRPVPGNLSNIRQRIREGYTIEQAEMVVRYKDSVWGTNPDMKKYLRPITLFGTKFDSYLNEAVEFCDCGGCDLRIMDPAWPGQHSKNGSPMDPRAYLKERQDIITRRKGP